MQHTELIDLKSFFKRCRQLIEGGKQEQALADLVYAIRGEILDPVGLASAGRLVQRITPLLNDNNSLPSYNIAILGQFTTSYLAPLLSAYAASENNFLTIQSEHYDSVMQSSSQLDSTTDIVVLLPWNQRLLANIKMPYEELISNELKFWQQVWQFIRSNSQARIVQVSYDWCDSGPSGQMKGGAYGGELHCIRRLNQLLRENLPSSAYFVDLEVIAGQFGRRQFYDMRNYHWVKQPFSEGGLAFLAKHLWSGMRALLTGPKKVLVLDLDNTLWGGVVGEVGALGVELGGGPTGDAYVAFQNTLKSLTNLGVLLAVCSKNNESDALEVFEKNKNMVLQLKDFAAFKAGWGLKSDAIKIIACELNLGLDSFVFFDDSPFEREQVRSALPEVSVVNVPADPAYYRSVLLEGLWFESLTTTKEDLQRAEHYQQESLRLQSHSSFDSVDHYLESLAMEAEVNEIDENNIDRVVQLLGKTNQFNLTTRRHSKDAVAQMLSRPNAVGFCLKLKDRFGDYGLVAVLLAYSDELNKDDLIIDSWLMSCRTIARGVEHYLYNFLVEYAKSCNFSHVIGEYIPTAKNKLVQNLYPSLGFTVSDGNKNPKYVLTVARATKALTYVQPRQSND